MRRSTVAKLALVGAGSLAAGALASMAFSQRGRPGGPARARRLSGPDLVPFPAIEEHAIIGDRRTAAVVAADGAISWFCAPDYADPPIFGALLDVDKGGFWRLGPAELLLGEQRYEENTCTLVTRWQTADGVLELHDAMLEPQTNRSSRENERTTVRRLVCRSGRVQCRMDLRPRDDFSAPARARADDGAVLFEIGEREFRFWSSLPVQPEAHSAESEFTLSKGEAVWCVLSLGGPEEWSADIAERRLKETERYWRKWAGALSYTGPRKEQVVRSAITFHLLSFAPTGALVAAPTTSLPERIGGPKNYDYRYAWIRDVSLSIAVLSMLGALGTAKRYMEWLSGLDSSSELPLQVLYGIHSELELEQRERQELSGYRQSKPVKIGNHAYSQFQTDGLGYLADCAHVYLQEGGEWRPEFSALIRKNAEFIVENWQRPTNGIWELGEPQHFVLDKVMAWVTLERSCKIAEKVGMDADTGRWRAEMETIREEVLDKGWSEGLQAFRQRYEAESLDASVLLMAVMEFLPADDERMRSTIERIAEALSVDGLVYRFDPQAQAEPSDYPLGEAEGAFVPCTFWLVTALAMIGENERAESILRSVEEVAGQPALFAEEVDPRSRTFLGNTPLLFSHAAYFKAVRSLAKSEPIGVAGVMFSRLAMRVRRALGAGPHRAEEMKHGRTDDAGDQRRHEPAGA